LISRRRASGRAVTQVTGRSCERRCCAATCRQRRGGRACR
jgi:hypothetical protein